MDLELDSRLAPMNDVKWGCMVNHALSSVRSSARFLAVVAVAWLVAASGRAVAADAMLGRDAPDFALPAVAGANVRLSEYLGQPVILGFWSSSCSGCARQLATLNRLYKTYRSAGLVVLGVSVDDDLRQAEQYARSRGESFPMLLDQSKGVGRSFAVSRLPTLVLIDRSGVVRYLHSDDRANDGTYVNEIRALLDDGA
jgi:peroxiredoxin